MLLLSVNQRIREIGIRLAVGAKRRQILCQFLTEAMVLGAASSILGITLGCAGANGISAITGWPTIIRFQTVLLSLVSSLGVVLLFAIGPAYKAARLNPIDALK
jgi:putative ABC transport system permease protein